MLIFSPSLIDNIENKILLLNVNKDFYFPLNILGLNSTNLQVYVDNIKFSLDSFINMSYFLAYVERDYYIEVLEEILNDYNYKLPKEIVQNLNFISIKEQYLFSKNISINKYMLNLSPSQINNVQNNILLLNITNNDYIRLNIIGFNSVNSEVYVENNSVNLELYINKFYFVSYVKDIKNVEEEQKFTISLYNKEFKKINVNLSNFNNNKIQLCNYENNIIFANRTQLIPYFKQYNNNLLGFSEDEFIILNYKSSKNELITVNSENIISIPQLQKYAGANDLPNFLYNDNNKELNFYVNNLYLQSNLLKIIKISNFDLNNLNSIQNIDNNITIKFIYLPFPIFSYVNLYLNNGVFINFFKEQYVVYGYDFSISSNTPYISPFNRFILPL
jgi:hypothetical protein